jgi:hypothetical protein
VRACDHACVCACNAQFVCVCAPAQPLRTRTRPPTHLCALVRSRAPSVAHVGRAALRQLRLELLVVGLQPRQQLPVLLDQPRHVVWALAVSVRLAARCWWRAVRHVEGLGRGGWGGRRRYACSSHAPHACVCACIRPPRRANLAHARRMHAHRRWARVMRSPMTRATRVTRSATADPRPTLCARTARD